DLLQHCLNHPTGGTTPSDFPLAHLDQHTLDRLNLGRNVEDVHPLTPMQQGMLFHTLLAPDSSSYFEQTILSLEGVTDVRALARAWQTVTDATPVLRSFVVHQGLAEPVQVVLRDVTVPVVTEDWRGLSEDEQRAALREFLARDEAAGIDPTTPPLSRVALTRLTDTRVQIVWTF
ncbi:condensation domain-containing protein, partial [Streptomyces thermolineatus]|uniref:condensation domain-containing protein n=1 Tax=Streptomyces thermolineatus TaxID=44033 RepID=UPI0031D3307D